MEVAPDRLNGIIKADYDRWIAIIREAGIRRSNDWRRRDSPERPSGESVHTA